MTQRVRLTSHAAFRFPDLANRTGTVMRTDLPAHWSHVLWDGHGYAWMPDTDLEPAQPDAAEPETTL